VDGVARAAAKIALRISVLFLFPALAIGGYLAVAGFATRR